MKKTKLIYACAVSLLITGNILAQDDHPDQHGTTADSVLKQAKPANKEWLKINFNEDGSNYARIAYVGQMWVTDNQNNPGSLVNGVATPNSYQVALRRARLTLSSQVTDKVFIFGQIGSDGISSLPGGRSLPLQYLDFTVEYKLAGKWLSLGGGLSGWDGLARYSNPAVPSILGLDMPLYQQATVNITDNTVRMPGIFAKGKLGKLDYRVAADIPYPTTTTTAWTNTLTVASTTVNPLFNASTFATNKVQPQFQGYFMYQFLDQESNLTPGTVGSYLGQKRVFNIGAGFRYQQNALWQAGYQQGANTAGTQTLTLKDTTRTAMFLWSVDLFYDAPINKEKGSAITIYAAYSNFNFGKNYVRNNNPLNPTGTAVANPIAGVGTNTVTGGFNPNMASFSGAGNQFPMIGSGSIYYAQAGYLMPKFKNGTQFQPYGQCMYANYQALKDAVVLLDFGVNYIIKGHNSKLSLDYQSRPVFNLSTTDYQIHEVKNARKGAIILQYQISF